MIAPQEGSSPEENQIVDHGGHGASGGRHLPMQGDGGPGVGQAMDPVCGMTVDIANATARGLSYRHDDVDYYFCGRGCRLDFEEDPARYLDPGYQPSM
jgi:Cu+-exporting ATPase